jgi:hypothetical protein
MNITSTITANHDHSMIPSEASGKRKASDDNSQNPNSAPKAKRTRKDVSSSSFVRLVLIIKVSRNRMPPPTSGNVRDYLSSSVVLSC